MTLEPPQGSYRQVVETLSEALKQRGWDSMILAYRHAKISPANVSKSPNDNWLIRRIGLNTLAIRITLSLIFLNRLVQKSKRVRGIFAETCWILLPCLVASRINRIPLFLHLHSIESEAKFGNNLPNRLLALFLEKLGATFSNAVFVVSKDDKARLVSIGSDPAKVYVLPIAVDLQRYSDSGPIEILRAIYEPGGLPIVAFLGGMSYPPNRDAAHIIARELEPRLNSGKAKCAFLLIGPDPPKEVLGKNIKATGYVDDLPNYLNSVDVCIAPLWFGGGVKLKVLDYFAAGKPVVSTSIGIEGMLVRHGVQCLVADDFDTFARYISILLEDKKLAEELGRNARQYVFEDNRIDRSVGTLLQVVERAWEGHVSR